MSNTMTFRPNENGELTLVRQRNVLQSMKQSMPISSAYIIDMPIIKQSVKSSVKGKHFALALPILGMASGVAGAGIFWKTFMVYIFPIMMDIAKVWCAIKIAQAFYQEKIGGKDEGGGLSAFVTYGKWYLLFSLLPWGVELIDELGLRMLSELKVGGLPQ